MHTKGLEPRLITDTRIALEIPEGGDLALDPAGVGPRAVATVIDLLITTAVLFVCSIVLGIAGGFGEGIMFILAFLINWFYPVFFEVWKHGATPGKRSVGVAVVNDDGTPLTFSASVIRNLLRPVDVLPMGYMVGVITMLCTKRFQRLGDLAAGTIVVYTHEVTPAPVLDTKGKRAVPASLSTDEQRSLLAFAERSKTLSVQRQQELAELLQPVIQAEEPVLAIKQMANSMVGDFSAPSPNAKRGQEP